MPTPADAQRRARPEVQLLRRLTTPAGIALLYAAAAGTWILYSDHLLTAFARTPEQLTRLQSVKGMGYVVVTAIALYLLIRQGRRAVAASNRALREQERRYRQMFERTTAVALLIDPVAGIIEDANEAACRFYGYSRRELIGRPLGEVNTLPAPDLAAVLARARRDSGAFDFRHRTATGELRNVEVHSSPVVVGGRELLFSIVHDVTGRLAAERALEASEARARALLREASDAIFVADEEGRLIEANDRACALLGMPCGEVLGRDIASLFTTEALASEPLRRDELRAGHTVVLQRRMRRRDGSTVDVETSTKMLVDGRIQAIARDVTERRRLEEQLRQAQKMEAVGRLTGGIAHDLNNVLTIVLANAELLAQGLPDGRDDLRQDVDELRQSASRGAAMLRKLLGFSREVPLNPEPLDLAATAAGMRETLRRIVPAHIEIALETAPAVVRADAGAVEQILLNLATNARDAMPDGGRLTLATRVERIAGMVVEGRPTGGAYGCLEVRDTGHGMDRATAGRIFEPFFTTKPPGQGTGLGMTMIYGLVRQQGGMVEVDSAPGRGTTVLIRLPLEAEPPAPVARPATAASWPRGTERILLVEDEGGLRRAAARILTGLGYTVLTAGDGVEALDVLQQEPVDLVLTDLVMPRMGGRRLYDAIRAGGLPLRVLFTSGYTGDELKDLMPGDGPVLLRKPWSADELAQAVRSALDSPVAQPPAAAP